MPCGHRNRGLVTPQYNRAVHGTFSIWVGRKDVILEDIGVNDAAKIVL